MNEREYNAVREYLDDAYDDDLMAIVSAINAYNGECESMIWYDMSDFDEMCADMNPIEIANCIFYGDFNPNHDYFQYDGYGNFVSTDYITFDDSDKDEIMEALGNIPYYHMPDEITDVLDELEDDEEEDEEEEEEEEE